MWSHESTKDTKRMGPERLAGRFIRLRVFVALYLGLGAGDRGLTLADSGLD